MLAGLGTQEIVLIAVVILLLFGARRIPELMRGLGEGIRELRKGVSTAVDGIEEEAKDGQA